MRRKPACNRRASAARRGKFREFKALGSVASHAARQLLRSSGKFCRTGCGPWLPAGERPQPWRSAGLAPIVKPEGGGTAGAVAADRPPRQGGHPHRHAERLRHRGTAVRYARRRRHVGRRRFCRSPRRCSPRPATMSSASRFSSTITAPRPTARAPVAPAAISMTRARSPSASAFRITCSTMRAASRRR